MWAGAGGGRRSPRLSGPSRPETLARLARCGPDCARGREYVGRLERLGAWLVILLHSFRPQSGGLGQTVDLGRGKGKDAARTPGFSPPSPFGVLGQRPTIRLDQTVAKSHQFRLWQDTFYAHRDLNTRDSPGKVSRGALVYSPCIIGLLPFGKGAKRPERPHWKKTLEKVTGKNDVP